MTMKEAPELCMDCHMELGPNDAHTSLHDCIQALRTSLLHQKELAKSLAFDVSVQLMATLEELSLRPDVGVAYRVIQQLDPDKSEFRPLVLPPERVAGVFAAILKKYRELGDWSPLQELKLEGATYAYMAGQLTSELQFLLENAGPDGSGYFVISKEAREHALELIKKLGSKQLVGLDPPHSQSCRRE